MKVRPLAVEGIGLRAAASQVGAVVEMQLIGGRPIMGLTEVQRVTKEAVLSALAEGPGTYTLWCALS